MDWLVVCLPLMLVGIAIASVPLLLATHRQHKHELMRDLVPCVGTVPPVQLAVQDTASWTVCSECSAVWQTRKPTPSLPTWSFRPESSDRPRVPQASWARLDSNPLAAVRRHSVILGGHARVHEYMESLVTLRVKGPAALGLLAG